MEGKDDADWVPNTHARCIRGQQLPRRAVETSAPSNGLQHGLQGFEHARDPGFHRRAKALTENTDMVGSLRKKRKVVHGGKGADPNVSQGPPLRSTRGWDRAASTSDPADKAVNLGRSWDPGDQLRKGKGISSQAVSGAAHGDVTGFKPVVDMGGEPAGQAAVKRKRGRPRKSKDSEGGRDAVTQSADGARAEQRTTVVARDSAKLWGLPSRQLRIKADPMEASTKVPSSGPSWHGQSAADVGMTSNGRERGKPAEAGSVRAEQVAATAKTAVAPFWAMRPPGEVASSQQGMARGKASSLARDIRMSTKCSRELVRLVEAGLVQDGERVEYRDPSTKKALKTGVIAQGSCLVCDCCHVAMNLTEFESHTGRTYRRPAKNICLSDGRTLHQCKAQLRLLPPAAFSPAATQRQGGAGQGPETAKEHTGGEAATGLNDYRGICRLCGEGCELLGCSSCPTALHLACADLTAVPEGSWYCPLCRCSICGKSHFQAEGFGGDTILYCDQCSRLYHVSCLRESGREDLKSIPAGDWFCSAECCKVSRGLAELVGQRFILPDGFYVAVLREPSLPLIHLQEGQTGTAAQQAMASSREDCSALKKQREMSREMQKRLLELAQEVMTECFDPIRDDAAQDDLIPVVVRSGKTAQRDCSGFYTFLLGRGGDAIAAASVRVHGGEVAEVPLIATRFRFRRQGMCRRLMNQVEKILLGLGVHKLALPSLPEAFGTWKDAFGFEGMPLATRKAFLALDLMAFPGTEFLEKTLQPQEDQKPVHAEMAPGQPEAMAVKGTSSGGNGPGPGGGGLLFAVPHAATENAKARDLKNLDTTRGIMRITSPGSPEGRKLLGEYRRRRSALADVELLGLVPWYVGVPWMPVEPWWEAAGEGGCAAWCGALYLTRPNGRAPPTDVVAQWRKGEASIPCRSSWAPGAMHDWHGQAQEEWQANKDRQHAGAHMRQASSVTETSAEAEEQLPTLGFDSCGEGSSHAWGRQGTGLDDGNVLRGSTGSVHAGGVDAVVGEDQEDSMQAEGKVQQCGNRGLPARESLETGEQVSAESDALRAKSGSVRSSEQQHFLTGSTPTARRGRMPWAAAVTAARAMAEQGARNQGVGEMPCVDSRSEKENRMSVATRTVDGVAEAPAPPSDPRVTLPGAHAAQAIATASTLIARSVDGQSRRKLKLTQRGGGIAGAILGDRQVEAASSIMSNTPAGHNANGGNFMNVGRGVPDATPAATRLHAVDTWRRVEARRHVKYLHNLADLEGPALDHDAAPITPLAPPAGFQGLARLVELFGPNALSMPLNVSGPEGHVLGTPSERRMQCCPRMILPGSHTPPWAEVIGKSSSASVLQGAPDKQQSCAALDGRACLASKCLDPAQVAHHPAALKGARSDVFGQDGQAHPGSVLFVSQALRPGTGEAGKALPTRPQLECQEVAGGPANGHRDHRPSTASAVLVHPAESVDAKAVLFQGCGESVFPVSMEGAEGEGWVAEAAEGRGPGDTMPVTAVKEAMRMQRTKAAVKKHMWSVMAVRKEGRLEGMQLGLLRGGAKAGGGKVAA